MSNLRILWISVCSFLLYGSIVANPIIYRLVPSPSLFEIRQWEGMIWEWYASFNQSYTKPTSMGKTRISWKSILFPIHGNDMGYGNGIRWLPCEGMILCNWVKLYHFIRAGTAKCELAAGTWYNYGHITPTVFLCNMLLNDPASFP